MFREVEQQVIPPLHTSVLHALQQMIHMRRIQAPADGYLLHFSGILHSGLRSGTQSRSVRDISVKKIGYAHFHHVFPLFIDSAGWQCFIIS
jgi:hypothetical protein